MTGPAPARRRRRRRSVEARRRRTRRHLLRGAAAGAGLVVLGLGVWLAVGALGARGDLEAARDHATRARTALLDGDAAAAQREVDLAGERAASAHGRTSALPWRLVAPVPGLGAPFATTRDLAAVTDELTRTVLVPAAEAGTALSPAELRGPDGRVDLPALTAARAPLDRAATAAAGVAEQARAVPPAGWPAAVEEARTGLVTQTEELATTLRDTSTAATLLPPMLGAAGPRHYFLGFQTNAEARGTGGLLGGFAILDAEGGAVGLDRVASNRALADDLPPAVELGPDFDQLYRDYASTTLWQNSNVSPHFPHAARIWESLWQPQTGQQLDGALATDPVALSYLLEAVGPVRLPGGEQVTAENVVALTESEAYVRFADDNAGRKQFLTAIAAAVFDEVVTAPAGRTTALLRALGRATGEGRLMVHSTDPGEQEVLETTPLAHALPGTAAPHAEVVLTNASGNKLDYYVGRTIAYAGQGCGAPRRSTSVTLTLDSTAPSGGLPRYVDGRLDPDPTGPPGTVRELVSLYATRGARLVGASVDGVPRAVTAGVEEGHPVFRLDVELAPGATPVVVFDLVEPTVEGAATVPVQPLVRPAEVTVSLPECRRVQEQP